MSRGAVDAGRPDPASRPRCSVFVAASVDGFIARRDGAIDWLDALNARVPPGEDCGYAAFFSTVDAIVMGRGTLEKVASFPAWPYGEVPVVVLSTTLAASPPGVPSTVTVTREPPEAVVARLGAAGRRRVYVDGGATLRSFLAAGLVDDLTVTTVPVLLGDGLPLFGPCGPGASLVLESSRSWPFGFVQSTWRVARPAG